MGRPPASDPLRIIASLEVVFVLLLGQPTLLTGGLGGFSALALCTVTLATSIPPITEMHFPAMQAFISGS